MTTTIQYRYFEYETLEGESQVQTPDLPDPALIPEIGHEFPLAPPAEGWARAIAVEKEIRKELASADETHIITIKFERV